MGLEKFGVSLIACAMIVFNFIPCSTSQGDVPKPTFPKSFEVEVQGIFLDQLKELDGRIHYDKDNNRAMISYTLEGETETSIYKFSTNEFIYIKGPKCSVNEIVNDGGGSFFPFTMEDKGKKVLASPERIFYFSNSELERQELVAGLPTYIYTAKVDFPKYNRSNCDITHVFSKPEVEQPDCVGHTCHPTLMSINVKCPPREDKGETKAMEKTYNFFRFRKDIRDLEVFQPPPGVHCATASKERFPAFPQYFSLSFHIAEDMGAAAALGVYSYQRKVWYDSKLNLIRIDEYDFNGLLESSRIFDFYGGVLYSTVASISNCSAQPIIGKVSLEEMTKLPKIFFSKTPTSEGAVYVGQRHVHGMLYYIWSSSFVDDETNAENVQEFYFSKIILDDEGSSQLKPSHVDSYIYQTNPETLAIKRSVLSRLTMSNFRSKPQEWEAFDVSLCFSSDKKKGFRLKVSGPDIVEYSYAYEDLLEKMYIKLIIATNVSVIRISELKGKFDGLRITEFTGWILEKPSSSGSMTGEAEPDMLTAYDIIEKAASEGKLSIKIKKLEQEIKYDVTAIEEVPVITNSKRDCFSGGSLAATGLVLLMIGITFSFVGYYVFLKKRKPLSDDKVQLSSVLS